MNHIFWVPLLDRHRERIENDLCGQVGLHGPADDLPTPHVENHAERRGRARRYLVTPPKSRLPDRYWLPWQAALDAPDHDHWIDFYLTEDGYEAVY